MSYMSELFGFTKKELKIFYAQTIACGDFGILKMRVEEGLQFFKKFCESLVFEEYDARSISNAFYYTCQNTILSQKKFPFEAIQILPPFSDYGRENFIRLLQSWEKGGEFALESIYRRIFSIDWEDERKAEKEAVHIISGDSETQESAVKFATADIEKRIKLERLFINYLYGLEGTGWKREIHSTIPSLKDNKIFSLWNISLRDKTRKAVYFDTNREIEYIYRKINIFKYMLDKKCKIHGNLLKEGKATVQYGLIKVNEKMIEARNKLFPNAMSKVLGGCSPNENINAVKVLFCEECRKVETAWKTANGIHELKIGNIRI